MSPIHAPGPDFSDAILTSDVSTSNCKDSFIL